LSAPPPGKVLAITFDDVGGRRLSPCDDDAGGRRLATSGVTDATQIHTHHCYSEFGEVIGAIADLDADVTSAN